MTAELLAAIPGRHAQPDPNQLATLPKGGTNLTYMGHAEVTLALIDVDPLWTWEPLAFDPETGGPVIATQGNRLVMWGRLTVHGKPIIGVGTCEARKGDPEKELIGDFLRNAAMRFGIGTKLWSKATDADPVSHGAAGGYDRPKPNPHGVLWLRILDAGKADKGMGAALKAEAELWGTKLTERALHDVPGLADALRGILDGETPGVVAARDAAYDAQEVPL